MFCSRTSNNMINKIHERALRIILYDKTSSFADTLGKNVDITNHQRNVQVLMTELFKIMKIIQLLNMFTLCVNNFNLRNFQELATKKKETVKYGLDILSYRCPQLWTLMPDAIKNSSSLIQFKSKTKF